VLPSFTSDGYLPAGVHPTTWDEIDAKYGYNVHRARLLEGLKRGVRSLRIAGCRLVYLNGSFITAKRLPEDYDVCWDETGVDLDVIDPVLINFENKQEAQKRKYFGEFFPTTFIAQLSPRLFYLDFFQRIPFTEEMKGICQLNV